MSIPVIGGGKVIAGFTTGEVLAVNFPAPATAAGTATITAAQLATRHIVGNPSTSAADYTLPTVALWEAEVPNFENIGDSVDIVITNLGTGSGVITVVAGTGWTLSGLATVAVTSAAIFRARKTGTGTWTLYRIAT